MAAGNKLVRKFTIALIAIAVAAAVAAGGWFWVVPALARDQARLFLADFWAGGIEIEGLKVALNGLTKVQSIRLTDEWGKVWAQLETITIRPKSWPTLEAAPAEVHIVSAVFRVHVTRGQVLAPLRRATQPFPEKFSIGRLSLAVASDTGFQREWGELHLQVTRKDNSYQFLADSLPLRADGQVIANGTVDVSDGAADLRMTGSACRGTFAASAAAGFDRAGEFGYTVNLEADSVDLNSAASHLLQRRLAPGGRLAAKCVLRGKGMDIAGMECPRGRLVVKGADLAGMPGAAEVLGVMGLPLEAGPTRGDMECRFTAVASRIYLQKGEATTPLSAVMAEPGGTIDLRTRQVNLYLVGVPLRQLRDALSLLGEPVVRLKDSLTRVHVKGRWDQPVSELVRKEPIEDLASTTVGFFQTVVGAADSLRGNGLGAVRDALRNAFEDDSAATKPTSRPTPPQTGEAPPE
jgi:hypothetical protein